jgi:CRISPR/Cas system CMR subunit Cmr4 (Cas7 group RAMP superfamily)
MTQSSLKLEPSAAEKELGSCLLVGDLKGCRGRDLSRHLPRIRRETGGRCDGPLWSQERVPGVEDQLLSGIFSLSQTCSVKLDVSMRH